MNRPHIDALVNAVLYEGHVLYPYRESARINRPCFTLGHVYPEAHESTGPSAIRTECLVEGPATTRLEITARFLQPMARDIGQLAAPLRDMPAPNYPDFFHVVPLLEIDGKLFQSGEEAVERTLEIPSLSLGELCAQERRIPFNFVATRSIEPLFNATAHIAGVIVRGQEAIEGAVEISAEPVGTELVRVTVRIVNHSPVPADCLADADEVLFRTFASAHTLLHVRGGDFVSLLDPPEIHAPAAAACRNIGTMPVLIGEDARRDTMLSSPVRLADFPQIADEIEETLTLPITAMTDDFWHRDRQPAPTAHEN